MKRVNLATAATFGAVGLYLLISSFDFPAGMGRLPGPGFFPGIVGAAMTLLALMLAVSAWRAEAAGAPPLGGRLRLTLAVALLAGYVLGWGLIPFPVRTAVFVVAFLRLVGQPWRASLTVGALLTAGVVLAFQQGLRVSLQ